jgi:hypothetical protein
MEIIKKKILQALTTGVTFNVTGGTEHVIIPDLNATYYLKFSLDSQIRDLGFMDAFVSATTTQGGGETPAEPTPEIPIINTGSFAISGFFKLIEDNIILAYNYAPITEYGVLYTNSSTYSTQSTLTYENYLSNPTIVRRISSTTTVGVAIPFYFTKKVIPLNDQTFYYRAYAINSVGVGYGLVKSQYVGETIPLD